VRISDHVRSRAGHTWICCAIARGGVRDLIGIWADLLIRDMVGGVWRISCGCRARMPGSRAVMVRDPDTTASGRRWQMLNDEKKVMGL
jgi:hypothetical protein